MAPEFRHKNHSDFTHILRYKTDRQINVNGWEKITITCLYVHTHILVCPEPNVTAFAYIVSQLYDRGSPPTST